MKRLILSVSLLCFSYFSLAQISPEWVRYPAISPDGQTIAFTYRGDIYSVSTAGGQATRLTFHKAHDFKPIWNKDGDKIAFASARHGNFDIYVMDALGGIATRLTYHSSDEIPYTFDNDGANILFKGLRMDTAAHRQHPTGAQQELYSVPAQGGRVEQVLTTPAEQVQFNATGTEFVYQDNKGFENEWRKHHRSSIARDIWRYNIKSGQHTKITSFEGEDRDPIYTGQGNSVFYLSEQSGSFNVHQLNLDNPSVSQALTNFELHPVRFLSFANNTLAFSHHGTLYTMAPDGQPAPVNITIRTQDIENSEMMLPVNGEISDMSISRDGKQLTFISQGEVFVSSTDGAFTKQITHSHAQEASVSFSPDGDTVVYASERNGKWSIYQAKKVREQEPFFYAATLIEETPLISNDKDNYQPAISPDGKKIAFIEDRRTLRVMDLESKEVTTLLTPQSAIHMRDNDQYFSWSPDSNWILFQYNKLLHNADVAIVSANGGEAKRVLVPSGYYDTRPKWVNEGKQIIWFSNREGLKSYATSGRSQYDVYTLFLTQSDWDEFTMSEDDFKLMQAIDEANTPTKDDDEADEAEETSEDTAVEPIQIDWDNLDQRIAKLTIHSSDLGDAVLNKDSDTLYYLSRFEDDYDLWQTNLRTKETKKAISLGARGGMLKWDEDMENLYLLSDGGISSLDIEAGKSERINISEQVLIDQNEVRKEDFEHVWLRTAKVFYEPTYHGVDWPLMKQEYQPKVAHVANSYEFTELLSEMLGELNVSHSGARYRGGIENGDATASLGIFYDYAHKGNGIKITEVLQGGPLDKAAFDIAPGMIVQKIDGQAITPDIDWARLLNRKASDFVLLDISNDDGDDAQQITVKPISLGEQSRLLYQRFVKINEREVLEKSNGQLGYVHIPGMADGPFRSIYDDMLGRFFDKKGMVVDARFNGGGDLVADLAMFFTGEPFLSYEIEGKVVGGEPTSRYTKPIISIFNESMYSDGHCYASGYQDLNLGKSVGMPVPGTCSFAGWEGLASGGSWGFVPVSAKNKAGEWLENNQTAPDIILSNDPAVIINGVDQQLERSIQELMDEVSQ
jgi:Tol biopolymer transport system component/C-terminal processing protease CtpA/Prc